MIVAAFVTFTVFVLMLNWLSAQTTRRLFGYAMWIDIFVHGSILYMFFGTSTMGLLQAEAAGILFSLYIRVYRWGWGYERYTAWPGRGLCWVRTAGKFTRAAIRPPLTGASP